VIQPWTSILLIIQCRVQINHLSAGLPSPESRGPSPGSRPGAYFVPVECFRVSSTGSADLRHCNARCVSSKHPDQANICWEFTLDLVTSPKTKIETYRNPLTSWSFPNTMIVQGGAGESKSFHWRRAVKKKPPTPTLEAEGGDSFEAGRSRTCGSRIRISCLRRVSQRPAQSILQPAEAFNDLSLLNYSWTPDSEPMFRSDVMRCTLRESRQPHLELPYLEARHEPLSWRTLFDVG
jgi:hypothetical protein